MGMVDEGYLQPKLDRRKRKTRAKAKSKLAGRVLGLAPISVQFESQWARQMFEDVPGFSLRLRCWRSGQVHWPGVRVVGSCGDPVYFESRGSCHEDDKGALPSRLEILAMMSPNQNPIPWLEFRSSCRASSKIVGEFLNPWGNLVQISWPLIPISGSLCHIVIPIRTGGGKISINDRRIFQRGPGRSWHCFSGCLQGLVPLLRGEKDT